jgi:hypothetical protein
MLQHITRNQLVGFWFAGVAVIVAAMIVMGVNVGVSTTAVLLTLSLVPPGMIVALWGNAPPPTIAEVLYEANRRTDERS